ncbi:hypothetical protein DIJ64_05355 [Mycobacterium leprae]|uniref:Uncharacterized protein n=1 Tax=Mycobacterium leprae TaxID=1769 RepID=A0AAD0P6N1_MYCLR|nr:hypothetical protein DIJ64_05355 [Mycobacterium leprae]
MFSGPELIVVPGSDPMGGRWLKRAVLVPTDLCGDGICQVGQGLDWYATKWVVMEYALGLVEL